MSGAPRPETVAQRRERIRAQIAETGFVRVTDLAAQFDTSVVTIRADLAELESSGALRRVRGGAVPARTGGMREQPFEAQAQSLAALKYNIGERAAALVASGDTLFIDVGSTTAAFARALVARDDLADVTIVTNGLNIALDVERAVPRFSVVVTGGTLRPLQHSLVNPLGEVLLAGIHADWAFIGCNGVACATGVTNVNIAETDVKRLMIDHAAQTVVLADATKIGVTEVAQIVSIEQVDTLVTSAGAPKAELDALRARGVRVDAG